MRLSQPLDFTYKGYLRKVCYNGELTEEEEIFRLLEKFRRISDFRHVALPTFFLIDYCNASYKFMTEGFDSVVGHRSMDFIEGGLSMVMNIFHSADFKIYNENVFASNLLFLKNTPQKEHHKYIFSYTFRVRCLNGKYKCMLQRGSYITSKETNLPLYSLGIVLDVTHLKTDTVMLHTIEKADELNGALNTTTAESNYFYPHEEDTLFTGQEKNILRWIADGLSSKQLADKLFVSEHTIITHRKNMLRKTNAKNVAELVAFSIRNRII
ncbi:helix-turn-helix transcriptional regulator [Mucilaginibacter sp.]|uniref:response regulator transcription factor n=1 Tax=Mucilaginibacter sp. TaxID=1882438 RepID=UPI002ED61A6D